MAKQTKKIQKNSNKQPTLSAMLKEEVSVYDEFVEFTWGSTELKLYPFFKPELVKNLVNEFYTFIALCEQEKVELKEDEKDDFLCYLMIKYFTSVKTTKGKKAKTIYDEFKLVINSKFYTEVMGLFPKESTDSVFRRKLEVEEMYAKLGEELMKAQEQYGELDLENRELIETAFKNKHEKDLAKSEDNEIVQ